MHKKSAQEKAERDAKNTNLAKFLVNVESRIYAQLSKQLADAMFAEGSADDSGTFDFQGTSISYVKTGTDVTLTITESQWKSHRNYCAFVEFCILMRRLLLILLVGVLPGCANIHMELAQEEPIKVTAKQESLGSTAQL
jgi:hypothetical protein